jgi:hypothetical protein
MPHFIQHGLSDEERGGEGRGGEEVELMEDCVGVGEDPGESRRKGRRGREVGGGTEVVFPDD